MLAASHSLRLDFDRIKLEYIAEDGCLSPTSLNATLLCVLRERLRSKNYEMKPQLFLDEIDNHNAFTRTLLQRSNHSKTHRMPIGLTSLKNSPYLLYLLNYHEQRKPAKPLTSLETYLIEMLFPRWDFLVSPDGDEYVYMILLPKSERDLLLLNTDLSVLMHDLIAHYSLKKIDNGVPIYDDCRCVVDSLVDGIEAKVGSRSPFAMLKSEEPCQKVQEEQPGS